MTTDSVHRIVLDNNLVISRMLFPQGRAAKAFDLAFASATLLISRTLAEELIRINRRSKFDRYLPLPERSEFVDRYIGSCLSAQTTGAVYGCRDPKDDHVLDLALAGRADLIISGDADLLALHPWRNISILTPADFLAQPSARSTPAQP